MFCSVRDEAEELPAVGGGVARVRAAPRRVRRLDQLSRQLSPKEPLRGDLIHSSQFESKYKLISNQGGHRRRRLLRLLVTRVGEAHDVELLGRRRKATGEMR